MRVIFNPVKKDKEPRPLDLEQTSKLSSPIFNFFFSHFAYVLLSYLTEKLEKLYTEVYQPTLKSELCRQSWTEWHESTQKSHRSREEVKPVSSV
jgi:hypothetical protein